MSSTQFLKQLLPRLHVKPPTAADIDLTPEQLRADLQEFVNVLRLDPTVNSLSLPDINPAAIQPRHLNPSTIISKAYQQVAREHRSWRTIPGCTCKITTPQNGCYVLAEVLDQPPRMVTIGRVYIPTPHKCYNTITHMNIKLDVPDPPWNVIDQSPLAELLAERIRFWSTVARPAEGLVYWVFYLHSNKIAHAWLPDTHTITFADLRTMQAVQRALMHTPNLRRWLPHVQPFNASPIIWETQLGMIVSAIVNQAINLEDDIVQSRGACVGDGVLTKYTTLLQEATRLQSVCQTVLQVAQQVQALHNTRTAETHLAELVFTGNEIPF